MKIFGIVGLFSLFVSSVCFAQAPANQTRLFYDSNTNLQYVCKATSVQPVESNSPIVTAFATTPIKIILTANHGLQTGSSVRIGIPRIGITTGMTGLLGTFVVTIDPTDPRAMTLNGSTGGGSYTGGAIMYTTAPRGTSPVWSISQLLYNSAGQVSTVLNGGVTAIQSQICDNRALLVYQ